MWFGLVGRSDRKLQPEAASHVLCKGAVLLADMVPNNRLTMELWVFLVGVGLVMCGNIRGDSVVATIGILIMVVDVVIYIAELARVFRY
jgi:hypothetical protein